MLNIPTSVKALFNRDGVRKNFRAHFPNGELDDITNKNIVQESVRFTESICSQDVLKFGLTESSVIEFETVGVPNMYGMLIECFCEVDVSSLSETELDEIRAGEWDGEIPNTLDTGYTIFRIPYGVFRVESCPRNHNAMTHRKVTAYSLSYSNLNHSFVDLPEMAAWPEFIVDPAAFYSQLDETKLVETEIDASKPFAAQFTSAPVYNRAGTYYVLGVYVKRQYPEDDAVKYFELENCDFAKVDIQYDAAAYEAEGLRIVKLLDDAGYDLSRTAAGAKQYKNNEEALRDRYPELFAPVLQMVGKEEYKEAGLVYQSPIRGPLWSQPLTNGKLIPIAGYERNPTESSYDYAFSGIPENKEIVNVYPRIYFISTLQGETPSIMLYNYSTWEKVWQVSVNYPPVNINYIKTYQRANKSDSRIKIANTASAQSCIVRLANKAIRVFRYSFTDAYDREKMLDGYLELNAMFGKVNRSGQIVGLRLSTDNPVEVSPGQYSGFWWDEFDVEPIGSVIFKYTENDEEQTTVYTFGSGASVYDMGDNAVINSLADATLEDIQKLIQDNFVPHLLPVAFTPIDLAMQGKPYLEDGDYLAVTSADGTVAHSFNMRHELSGIQFLEAEVTSVSGQIMDSEVEV